MRIVFVYPDFMKGAQGKYHEGIASLSAALKTNGHEVRLLHIVKKISSVEFAEIFRTKYSDADLLAFSSTTNTFPYVAEYAKEIRKTTSILTICGGIHPTLCPEESIGVDGIDIICRGEGEYAMSELCGRLQKGEDISNIQSLWIKRGENIVRNDVRPVPENLDLLPTPDRGIFDYENSVDHKWGRLVFMASRGCPFNCAHCCNGEISRIYPNPSKYVRFKSVDRLLQEIKHCLIGRPNVRQICFHDDILLFKKAWFRDFAPRYKKEINIPYICNSRFDLMDEEVIGILKETRCIAVKLGLESGNDFVRKEVLKRQQNRKDIIKVSEICRKTELSLYTFNMVGIPFENLDRILDTIKLNALLRPHDMQVSIFYPYPKTDLYEMCKKKKLLTTRTLPSYVERDTILKLNDFPKNKLLFAYDNFKNFVRYYEFSLLLPIKFREFLEKVLNFLWVHPRIYCLAQPFLLVARYFCGLTIWIAKKTTKWSNRREKKD